MTTQNSVSFNYIDGIGAIAVADGVVRFDLVSVMSFENGKGVTARTGGLAMSLPAMLKIHNQLGQLISELAQKGVLQKNNGPAATTPAPALRKGDSAKKKANTP